MKFSSLVNRRPVQLALAIIIAFALLSGLSVAATPANNSLSRGLRYTVSYGFDQLPQNSVDILLVGDSSMQCGVSVPTLQAAGVSSYNSGSPNQTVFESADIVEKAFQTQNPRVVVLEVNEVFAGAVATSDAAQAQLQSLLPILKYHDNWKLLLGGKSTQFDLLKRGFNQSDTVVPYTGGGYMQKTKGDLSMPRRAVEYYDRIARICQEHGSKLVLLNVPNSSSWNGSYHDAVQTYANEAGLDYIDLNTKLQDLGLDWSTDTRDGGEHLNTSGATKVANWLASHV